MITRSSCERSSRLRSGDCEGRQQGREAAAATAHSRAELDGAIAGLSFVHVSPAVHGMQSCHTHSRQLHPLTVCLCLSEQLRDDHRHEHDKATDENLQGAIAVKGTSPKRQVSVLEQLTGLERGPAPRWDTFCGVSGGAWQGQVAAFSPATGQSHKLCLESSVTRRLGYAAVIVHHIITHEYLQGRGGSGGMAALTAQAKDARVLDP